MSNYIFQIGATSVAQDIDKVEDMVKLEETVAMSFARFAPLVTYVSPQ